MDEAILENKDTKKRENERGGLREMNIGIIESEQKSI